MKTFKLNKSIFIENYEYALKCLRHTSIRTEVTEKLFYEKVLDDPFFDDKIFWTNSLYRKNKNTLFLNRFDLNSGGGIWNDYEALVKNKILDKKSNYRIWIPLDTMEKREGISINEAIALIQRLEDSGYRTEGLLVNGFCSENAHLNWQEALTKVDTIAGSHQLKVSVGGSAFLLQSNFLKELKNISSVRTGEFIITGRIADHHDELYRGENPFEIEVPVLWSSKSDNRFMIPMGRGLIHSDCMFEQPDIQISSISTDYTVLKADAPYNYQTLKIRPDYYTLSNVLEKWAELLECS